MTTNTLDLDATRALLVSTRRDSRQAPNAALGAYQLPGGAARITQGDDDAPWAKVVPFPRGVEALGPADQTLALTHTAAGLSPQIDVRDARFLTLYVAYTPGAINAILSLIPYPDGYPSAFVAAIASTLIPPGLTQDFASRSILPMELRTPAAAAAATPMLFQVTFDVGPNIVWLVSACDTVSALSTLTLGYALSN